MMVSCKRDIISHMQEELMIAGRTTGEGQAFWHWKLLIATAGHISFV